MIRLNEHESERFLAALVNPPAPAPKLLAATETYHTALADGRLEVASSCGNPEFDDGLKPIGRRAAGDPVE